MWKHACAFTKWVPSNQFMYSGLDYNPAEMTLERFGFIGMDKRCFWGSIGVLWKRPLPVDQILPNATISDGDNMENTMAGNGRRNRFRNRYGNGGRPFPINGGRPGPTNGGRPSPTNDIVKSGKLINYKSPDGMCLLPNGEGMAPSIGPCSIPRADKWFMWRSGEITVRKGPNKLCLTLGGTSKLSPITLEKCDSRRIEQRWKEKHT